PMVGRLVEPPPPGRPAPDAPARPATGAPEEAAATATALGGLGEVAAYRASLEEPSPLVEPEPGLPDDRDVLAEGDRVLLVVTGDTRLATTALRQGHERGFKVLLALRGDSGLSLARKHL